MKHGFYIKLALMNLRKNKKTYVPYILTCILTIMMYYMMKSLSLNPGIKQMIGAEVISYTLGLGNWVIGLFALIFLFYTNSFLIKRRQKEFGVFNILGMEKKHLAAVLFVETVIVTMASLVPGILLGIVFDKVMYLVICKILSAKVSLGFFVSGKAILNTVVIFGVIFLLIYLRTVYAIRVSNPMELLKGSNTGEKEPKAKWLLALVGLTMLGIGYGLALTIDNPLASIEVFFVAVLLVIVATYLLFTAGSIVILKLLRRNRRFYYQPGHFISVSGMMYRMKRNAVGLANICILATMVLVMLSTTTSLMVGMEDVIRARYPNDIGIYEVESGEQKDELNQKVDELFREKGISPDNKVAYDYLSIAAYQRGDTFRTKEDEINIEDVYANMRMLLFVPLSDYNKTSGEHRKLSDDEMLIFSNREPYEESDFKIFSREYRIKEQLKEFFGNGKSDSNIASSYYLIVSDKAYEEICESGRDSLGENFVLRSYRGFDLDIPENEKAQLASQIAGFMSGDEYEGYTVESRAGNRQSFLALYGSLFFLGIFLGTLFIVATVLIIYYKQITEGYEDRERFVIMQKVGMTQTEVKKAIRSQVLTVFFLPLLVAGVHVAAAFPLIRLLMSLLNMVNVKLYLLCTIVAFLIFAALYVVIYGLTAKTYYKIVKMN